MANVHINQPIVPGFQVRNICCSKKAIQIETGWCVVMDF